MAITESELIDIASRMAQELQDFIDEAVDAGCENPFPGTAALIEEWETAYRRTQFYAQSALVTKSGAAHAHSSSDSSNE